MLRNWKKYSFFLLILVAITAIVLYHHYRHKPVAVTLFVPPPVAVTLAQVQMQQWPTVVQGSGMVTAQHGVMIRAQVAGEIMQQFARSSSQVEAGAALYQIDPQGLAQLIKQDEAQVALMQDQLQEQQALYKKRFVSKNDYDTAVANYKIALNTLKQNKRKLALTKVTAPFSGTLGVMLVHKGETVRVNDPLVSLQNSQALRVDFTLPGNLANAPKLGQQVHLEVLQYPNHIFNGVVSSVNASIDPSTQTILVRAQLEKAAQMITPGAFATVQLYVDQPHPVLTVPQTALVYNDSGVFVYHVVKGVARLEPVSMGQRNGDRVAIVSGVKAGEWIVSEGKVKLMDGMRVTQALTKKVE